MLLVLLATDAHNAQSLMQMLPPQTVYTALELTSAEWGKTSERIASEYLVPIVARTQQQWPEAQQG